MRVSAAALQISQHYPIAPLPTSFHTLHKHRPLLASHLRQYVHYHPCPTTWRFNQTPCNIQHPKRHKQQDAPQPSFLASPPHHPSPPSTILTGPPAHAHRPYPAQQTPLHRKRKRGKREPTLLETFQEHVRAAAAARPGSGEKEVGLYPMPAFAGGSGDELEKRGVVGRPAVAPSLSPQLSTQLRWGGGGDVHVPGERGEEGSLGRGSVYQREGRHGGRGREGVYRQEERGERRREADVVDGSGPEGVGSDEEWIGTPRHRGRAGEGKGRERRLRRSPRLKENVRNGPNVRKARGRGRGRVFGGQGRRGDAVCVSVGGGKRKKGRKGQGRRRAKVYLCV